MLDQQADLETMLGCCNEVQRMAMHQQACQLQGIWKSFYSTQQREASAGAQTWAVSTTLEDQRELTWVLRKEQG